MAIIPSVCLGWGETSSGRGSDVLKEASQRILSSNHRYCKAESKIKPVPKSTLCSYNQGTDSCRGDSGGPLVVKENGRWTVVGVVSYGNKICATKGYAGVYARVTYYLDWINVHIKVST